MKINLLFLILLLAAFNGNTTAQNYEWAKQMGGVNTDEGHSITVDVSGNVYTTGYFIGTADFDSGPGIYNLTSVGYSDIFICKQDSAGNLLWVKQIGGTNSDEGHSIAVDSTGNVYTTGHFQGTADFDPGLGTFYLTSTGTYDIFISKLDANGNFIWAKNMGGSFGDNRGNSIAIDDSGNVYTTGHFQGTADFDPGTSTYNLIGAGGYDIFISKLDANGNFVWAKRMGGSSTDKAESIIIDDFNNIYTIGKFVGTADFDPGTSTYNLICTGTSDIFISKLDANGNFVWAKRMGGSNSSYGKDIAVDKYENVYTIGYFWGTTDFDPGLGTYNMTSAGSSDIFISKLDSTGNFVWAKRMGSTSADEGSSIILDTLSNVYTTGRSNTTFISKLDSAGNFVWTIGNSNGGNYANSICVNSSREIFTTGAFNGSTDFDPGAGTAILTSAGNYDIFVQKLSQCINTTSTDVITACDSLTWIDNVTYITSTTTPTFTLTNINGCDSVVTLNLTINSLNASYTSTDNGSGNYTFTNTSTGSFTQTHWAFGDGTTSTLANPTHTFSANGTYVVVLTINDSTTNNTCMDYYLDTLVVTGVVNPVPCAAGFVMYPDGNGNLVLVNSSTGNNLTYFWDFGDGDTSTMQFPSHTYATAGPFYLCLTVNDGASCVDTYCDSIGINGVLFNKQTGFSINVIAPPVVVGVDEQGALITDVTIYPNPTTNEFVVELTNFSPSTQINIISVEGKMVYTNSSINTNKINVDAANWSRGIYIVKITDKQSSKVVKLVKQ